MRLLATVLRKKFDKELPVHIPQHRYIIKEKDGPTRIPKGIKVSLRGPTTIPPKDRATKKKVPKFL